jgi:hypothetical protein
MHRALPLQQPGRWYAFCGPRRTEKPKKLGNGFIIKKECKTLWEVCSSLYATNTVQRKCSHKSEVNVTSLC